MYNAVYSSPSEVKLICPLFGCSRVPKAPVRLNYVIMHVDATMAVTFACYVIVRGSGYRCDYCMARNSVDIFRCHVMCLLSQYEMRDDGEMSIHSIVLYEQLVPTTRMS